MSGEEKSKKDVNERTAQASLRTLKKNVLCLSQSGTQCFGLRRNGKASVLWYLTVLRLFYLRNCFSLRGGGHYLPHGFRLSSLPLSFQSVVRAMGFTFYTFRLWWFSQMSL